VKVHASREERAKMTAHLESQSESEKAKAQADGTWQEGNLQQFELDRQSGARL
jgi:hypothetical protein